MSEITSGISSVARPDISMIRKGGHTFSDIIHLCDYVEHLESLGTIISTHCIKELYYKKDSIEFDALKVNKVNQIIVEPNFNLFIENALKSADWIKWDKVHASSKEAAEVYFKGKYPSLKWKVEPV